MSSAQPKNVFEAILKYGHDEDFDPIADANFLPTDAPAGSQEKIEILRRRVELGQPLWHVDDRVDYTLCRGLGQVIGRLADASGDTSEQVDTPTSTAGSAIQETEGDGCTNSETTREEQVQKREAKKRLKAQLRFELSMEEDTKK